MTSNKMSLQHDLKNGIAQQFISEYCLAQEKLYAYIEFVFLVAALCVQDVPVNCTSAVRTYSSTI